MNLQEALIQAIIEKPEDDAPRLVYADWLEENSEGAHAELIRVQCELARPTCSGGRRKELARRERELLASPSLHPPGGRAWEYERGFVAETCSLFLSDRGAHLITEPPLSATDVFGAGEEERAPPQQLVVMRRTQPLLGRLLHLTLRLDELEEELPGVKRPLVRACLRRVTHAECYDSYVAPEALKRLASLPDLINLREITFYDASQVHLDGVEALFLAPAVRRVTHLHLDGEDWTCDDVKGPLSGEDHPRVAAFIERLGASPKAAELTYLHLGYPAGPRVVRALIDAVNLRPKEQLCLFGTRRLARGLRQELKKRFGKALYLQ